MCVKLENYGTIYDTKIKEVSPSGEYAHLDVCGWHVRDAIHLVELLEENNEKDK